MLKRGPSPRRPPRLALAAVIDRSAGLEDEYRAVEARLGDPRSSSDPGRLRDETRSATRNSRPSSRRSAPYRGRLDDLAAATEMLDRDQPARSASMREEIAVAEADLSGWRPS